MPKNRKKNSPRPVVEEPYIKDFLDMVAPSVIDFKVDHYLCGNTCRCVWALREYPTSTDEQAILRHLGEMDGVTIRIYTRQVTPSEERRIIHNAANKHRMSRSSTEDLQQTVTAEANLQDVVTLVSSMHRNREPLLHCAVFLELTAPDYDALKLLQTDVLTELVRSKLNVDRLMLRQQEGFVSVMPAGRNAFGAQFERVLPASSVANLYPFNYSGKTDPHGFYIGKDKYGANILVDFDKRDDDKTSANILILGNSGQGKSYLLKLLLLNFLEAGKSVISLDVEHEQKDMCETVGGCFMDLMGGVYRINPLEPKCWDDGSGPEDRDAPEAFRKSTRLSQHISFLKDFFRAYKDFSDRHIDAIEIMVGKLYAKWGISDSTNFAGLKPQDYTLIVFNTCTQEYEEVIVTEEVYRAYCRTRWNIKDNDQSFFDHEIQTSGMIGSQDGAYENFREFIDAINTPEHIILEQIKKEALYQAISALPAADQALVQGLFFKGQSELDYAREIGVSQPAVHKRKVRILKSLKKLLEN